jgi:flagellin-specific chaperone FliS
MDVKIFEAITFLKAAKNCLKDAEAGKVKEARYKINNAISELKEALGEDLEREGKKCITAEVDE